MWSYLFRLDFLWAKRDITTELDGWTENKSRNISHFIPLEFSDDFFFATPKTAPVAAGCEILFVVFSAPGFRTRRDEIRVTWAAEARVSGFPVVFLVGRSSRQEIEDSLAKEQLTEGDLLRADFKDSYANLTIKSSALLLYATRLNVKFVVKVKIKLFYQCFQVVFSLLSRTG